MSVKSFVEEHRELMQSNVLQRSLDFALLEYQKQIAVRTEPQMASTGHFRMLGALEFIQIMKDLAESTPEPTKLVTPSLNHRA